MYVYKHNIQPQYTPKLILLATNKIIEYTPNLKWKYYSNSNPCKLYSNSNILNITKTYA